MPAGRPSKFNDAVREKIIELATQGMTDKQIAEIIGVHENTLNVWKRKDQQLQWSLKEAKLAADQLVEASLFMRACGYSHRETKVFQHQGEIVTHEVIKHYPPDPVSMIFWLKNRQPEEWREKIETENTNKEIKINIDADDEKL